MKVVKITQMVSTSPNSMFELYPLPGGNQPPSLDFGETLGARGKKRFSRIWREDPKNSIFDAEHGMIYLKIIHAIMKTKIQTFRVSFWVILGIVILLTNLALNRTSRMPQEPTATPAIQTDTVVATGEARNEAGSTNWIMFLAVVIVLIVIIPILLKRRAWENGKRNKTTPPG